MLQDLKQKSSVIIKYNSNNISYTFYNAKICSIFTLVYYLFHLIKQKFTIFKDN